MLINILQYQTYEKSNKPVTKAPGQVSVYQEQEDAILQFLTEPLRYKFSVFCFHLLTGADIWSNHV